MLLIAQICATASIAAWLTLGALDNIRHPQVNETYTAQVMAMTRMAEEYPDEFKLVAHRAVTNRKFQAGMFRLVVIAETIATLVLWAGVLVMIASLLGLSSNETGRVIAMCGSVMFTCVWSGFLIVGNYFCYWFCHEGAQNTHYQMTLWGLGTSILIAM